MSHTKAGYIIPTYLYQLELGHSEAHDFDLLAINYDVRLFKNATDIIRASLTIKIGVFQFLGHDMYARTNSQYTT